MALGVAVGFGGDSDPEGVADPEADGELDPEGEPVGDLLDEGLGFGLEVADGPTPGTDRPPGVRNAEGGRYCLAAIVASGSSGEHVNTAAANACARASFPACTGWSPSPDIQSGCAATIAVQATGTTLRWPSHTSVRAALAAAMPSPKVSGRTTSAHTMQRPGPASATIAAAARRKVPESASLVPLLTTITGGKVPSVGPQLEGGESVRGGAADDRVPRDVAVGHLVGQPRVGAEREGVPEHEDLLGRRQHRLWVTAVATAVGSGGALDAVGVGAGGVVPAAALGSPAARMARTTTRTAATVAIEAVAHRIRVAGTRASPGVSTRWIVCQTPQVPSAHLIICRRTG